MAIRFDYLARETGQNIVRNWLLSLATVLIVMVSLTTLGITMLFGFYGIDNAFAKWNNDVQFIVYMDSTATEDQIASVGKQLEDSPQVDRVEYFDDEQSYELFTKIFQNDEPELIAQMGVGDLPTSYRVKPTNPDAEVVRELAQTFDPKPGVFKADFPDEQVRQVQSAASKIRSYILAGVILLLLASVALIFIAIQTAMFSRRREIEVMRLVGATNWFIRIPFIVEGIVEGLVGAASASVVVGLVGRLWTGAGDEYQNSLVSKLVWTNSQLTWTLVVMMGIGAIVGAVGSILSVARYLKA